MSRPERRRTPRVSTQIPLIISHESGTLEAKTENLSATGAYCTLKHYLAPMTKLQIRLELPGGSKPATVNCQGVVVRVHPPAPTPKATYQLAIFFNELSDHGRSTLARYIRDRLPVATLR